MADLVVVGSVMTMRNYEQWMWCQVWYKTTVSPIHTPNVTVLTTADDLPIHNSNSLPMQPLMPVICCYCPSTMVSNAMLASRLTSILQTSSLFYKVESDPTTENKNAHDE